MRVSKVAELAMGSGWGLRERARPTHPGSQAEFPWSVRSGAYVGLSDGQPEEAIGAS